jgi:outer membrane immunogenic protein
MLRSFIVGAVSALALSSAADAADMYRAEGPGGYKDGPYVPVATWTGFYVGGHIGGAWSETKFTDYAAGGSVFQKGKFEPSGVIGGAQVGYNFQYGNVVFGGEVDLGGVDRSASRSFTGALLPKYSQDGSLYGDFTGRIGYAFDRVLVYAKGGGAFIDNEYKVSYSTPSTYTKGDTLWGWTVGGGAEYMVNPTWSVKVEYQHFDFENASVPTPIQGGGVKFRDDTIDAVTAGVNYHFGRGYEPLK